MKKILIAAAALAASCLTSSAWALGPSFDCNRASKADEIAICANPSLAVGDVLASAAFYQAKAKNHSATLAVTRNFLARRQACGFNGSCIAWEQANVMTLYRALGATMLDY